MRLIYEADPRFAVDEQDRVRPLDSRDRRTELGKRDGVIVDVFRSSRATVLTRASLRDACIARGMSTHQFNNATTTSPVLSRPANDAWCLVGASVSPAEIAGLRHARTPHERRVRGHGWTSAGALWIAAAVSREHAGAPVVHIPKSEAHHLVRRRFPAQTRDGSPAGTITVNARGESWGYDRFLAQQRRSDDGELLRIEFHLTDPKAILTLR